MYALTMESKKCTKCGEVKALDMFSAAPTGKFGRKSSCELCDAERYAASKAPKGYNYDAAEARYRERAALPKVCSACGVEKARSEYSKVRDGKFGPILHAQCKECRSVKAGQWFAANRDRANESRRRRNLGSQYGITVEQYDEMLARQGGVCAICGQDEPTEHGRTGTKFRLSVDHDHETGRVRDLLCQKCNRAIGLLGDSAAILRKAADYLDRHSQGGSRPRKG